MSQKKIFVVDTNVLVDYVDLIPGPNTKNLSETTVDLQHAHIVVPTAVIRELSSFKREKSYRGRSARTVLKRIRELVENSGQSMDETYCLKQPIPIRQGNQLLSILPIRHDFERFLPYHPSTSDMDGQIILAALAATCCIENIDTADISATSIIQKINSNNNQVTLLTNDNGLAIRAAARGLSTTRYSHKLPPPYTGRRDVIVTQELFHRFFFEDSISYDFWQETMPDEPDLVANEFIVMTLKNPQEYPREFDPANNPYFCNIGRYDAQQDAIVPLKYVSRFPVGIRNPGQAIYAEALENPNFSAVICTGPAGSGKTYMSTVYGYDACRRGNFIGITVVPCEDRSKIGALPGDLDEKMDPDVQPFKNALRNYLLDEDPKFRRDLEILQKFGTGSQARKEQKKEKLTDETPGRRSLKAQIKDRVDLIWDNWFSNIPIENARGRDFSYELALYDEFQDQNISQADTLIKRIGTNGKIVITGDINQIHSPYLDDSNNGLVYASQQLLDSPLVAQVYFTEDEVIRHPLVKMVTKRQKETSPL